MGPRLAGSISETEGREGIGGGGKGRRKEVPGVEDGAVRRADLGSGAELTNLLLCDWASHITLWAQSSHPSNGDTALQVSHENRWGSGLKVF